MIRSWSTATNEPEATTSNCPWHGLLSVSKLSPAGLARVFFGRLTNSWCRMRTPRTCMQAYGVYGLRMPGCLRAAHEALASLEPASTPQATHQRSGQRVLRSAGLKPQAHSETLAGCGPAETMAGISSAAQKPQRQRPTNASAARLHGRL